MLPSFEVENFRTFSHLQIPHLGGVNLVVGRNNVGKTMLLEALRLYACGGHPVAIASLLLGRDEVFTGQNAEERVPRIRVASLFFRRSMNSAAVLKTGVGDAASVRIEFSVVRQGLAPGKNKLLDVSYEPVNTGESADNMVTFEAITVYDGSQRKRYFLPFDRSSFLRSLPADSMEHLESWRLFLPTLPTRTL